MPYGYKLQFGVQRVTEPDPNRPRRKGGGLAMIVIIGFAVIIVCLLFIRPSTGGAAEPAAHIQPAARVAPTAAPSKSPATIRFTCQMPKAP